MTEDDAKKRWCPFAASRVVSFIDPQTRNPTEAWCKPDGADKTTVSCIASACMAWRWDSVPRTEGYCGLAGKP